MRVTGIETVPLRYTLPEAVWDAHLHIAYRDALIVRVTTDEGVDGIGEAAVFGGAMQAVASVIREQLAPLLVGMDPLLIERAWAAMNERTVHLGRAGIALAAISGIDIALWDIAGKVAGLPIYRLLGGMRDELETYASGGLYRARDSAAFVAAEVVEYRERGFAAAKIKVGGLDPRSDSERVRATRAAIGEDFDLFVDANCGYTAIEAVDFVRRVADLKVGWIEEPVRPDDLRGSQALVRLGMVPVAGYESETSAAAFRNLIMCEAVDIVQADVIWTGGFTQVRRIVALAHAFNLPFVPHVYSSAVSLVANAHLLAAAPNGGRLEFDARPHPLRDELVSEQLRVDSSCVFSLPQGPGLGIALNPDAIAAYRADL